MSERELVKLESPSEGIALVTLTDPARRNFGSWQAVGELAGALREAREDGCRVSLLASGLDGHWLEHAWLVDLEATLDGREASGDPGCWFRLLEEITHHDVVSIAAINGHCSGGGAELGWACDLRIADEQACFGQPEVMLGLTTGIGGTCRLAHLIGRTVTAEMVLDGSPLTARRLYELGGVNRVVPDGTCVDVAVAWAERLARRPPAALRGLKRILKGVLEHPLSEALRLEQTVFQEVARTPEAGATMRRVQERFDADASPVDVYGPPRD